MPEAKVVVSPDISDGELIPFTTKNEEWFTYELEDNTIIRSKFVLMEVIAVGEPNEQGRRLTYMGTHQLNVVFSPPELRDTPDKKWEASELEEYITDENLKFSQITDGGLYKYELENSTMEVDYRVYQVDKTSKYDAKGNPAYIIRTKTVIAGAKEE